MNTTQQTAMDFFKEYCTEEWLPLIEHHQQIIEVKKNEAFIKEGGEMTGVYILLNGKAKIVSHFYGRKEHIFRLAGEMTLVGHRSLFLKNYSISAIALTPAVVSFIPLNLFVRLYKANPLFNQFLLEFFARELQESEEQQYMLTIDSVRQRIAFSILRLIRIFGYEQHGSKRLAYTLPKKDFAVLCSTTYESVIRTLSAFEKEKIILRDGKTIVVLNEDRLRSISTEF